MSPFWVGLSIYHMNFNVVYFDHTIDSYILLKSQFKHLSFKSNSNKRIKGKILWNKILLILADWLTDKSLAECLSAVNCRRRRRRRRSSFRWRFALSVNYFYATFRRKNKAISRHFQCGGRWGSVDPLISACLYLLLP